MSIDNLIQTAKTMTVSQFIDWMQTNTDLSDVQIFYLVNLIVSELSK